MNDHCIRVVSKVPDEFKRVALLHDLAEDHPISLEEVAVTFRLKPWEVEALAALTRSGSITYRRYIAFIAMLGGLAGECARAVKIADLEDNLGRCKESLRKRYLDALETLDIASVIAVDIDLISSLDFP